MSNRNFHLAASVIWVATTKLLEANRKTRRHSVGKLKKLAASISDTGYFNPILADDEFRIIAGHARLEVAKRLDMSDVPVIVVRGLSEAQRRSLALADNRLSEEAKWDDDALRLELLDILELGAPLELTGFDSIEVDVRTSLPPLQDDDEEVPEPPATPLSALGDRWQCGEHILVCGDARDSAVYLDVLGDQKADMVFTDFPYNLKARAITGLGRAKHSDFAMAAGEMSDAEFIAFLRHVMLLLKASLRDGAVIFSCIDWRHIVEMVSVGEEVFETMLNICVWCKPNAGMGSFYRSQHEMVVVLKNGAAPHTNNVQLGRMGRYRSNVWQHPGGSSFSVSRKDDLAAHPTVKPTAMVAEAIRDVTVPGNLVIDPFGGSGTTMLAAQSVGRRAILIEIDPKYVDVSLDRFQAQTGIEPVLMPEGKPWSVAKSERQGDDHGK